MELEHLAESCKTGLWRLEELAAGACSASIHHLQEPPFAVSREHGQALQAWPVQALSLIKTH